MFPTNVVQWHAALNDLPAVLFVLSIALDLAGEWTHRESLKAAGFWTLVVGAGGAVPALITGLMAEDTIEHGEAVHQLMERHETMAISLTIFFGGLAIWRIWRRGTLGPKERPTYLMLAFVGALFTLWTAHLGGRMVFDLGAGISSQTMEEALHERAEGHHHGEAGEVGEAGEAQEHADSAARGDSSGHTHAPGTPPHEHD